MEPAAPASRCTVRSVTEGHDEITKLLACRCVYHAAIWWQSIGRLSRCRGFARGNNAGARQGTQPLRVRLRAPKFEGDVRLSRTLFYACDGIADGGASNDRNRLRARSPGHDSTA